MLQAAVAIDFHIRKKYYGSQWLPSTVLQAAVAIDFHTRKKYYGSQ